MLSVSGDEEFGLSRKGAFKDAIVIIHGCDDRDPLCGLNELCHGADGTDPSIGLPFGEAELLAQKTVELGQNRRGDEKLDLCSADAIKELVRLAAGKGKSGDQNVGVQDDPHRGGGLLAERMDESVDILFRPDPNGPGLQGSFLLEFPPPVFLKVHTQGLPDQLALGSVLFLGRTLRLSDKLGGKRDGPGFGGTHRVSSDIDSYLVR
jgi:hypothetical protein